MLNTVRTTISLPIDLHFELRRTAIEKRKSMGEVLVERLRGRLMNKADQVNNDQLLFQAVAKCGRKVDLMAELRKDRGRDDK